MIMSNIRYALKKLVVAVLMVAAFMAPARQAHALFGVGDIVFDPTIFVQETLSVLYQGELNVKDFVLDVLVRQAAEVARQTILRSIITWANSGFEGSPAFVTNLRQNLRGLSDYVVDSFTAELQASGVINSPFRDSLVAQLRDNYRRMSSDQAFFETNRYTLDQYSDDPDAFLRGDFSRGGIRAWIHAWMNPQNNPLGAYGAARRELEQRVASAVTDRRDEVNRNSGFLDFCVPPPSEEGESTSLRPAVVGCRPGDTRRNLGSLTHSAVERALGSDIDMIVSADEISELFQAIANGLFKRTFSEGGLLGLSESSSGGGGSPLDQTGNADVPVSTLLGAVDHQIQSLNEYKTNWQRVDSAVEEAQVACNSGGDAELIAEVTAAAARTLAALTEINSLLGELSTLRTKISQPGGGSTVTSRQAAQEFQTLVASGRLPTPSELTYAATQSQNIPGSEPPTIYTRMKEIAAERCR
jgi:hypothetical protein